MKYLKFILLFFFSSCSIFNNHEKIDSFHVKLMNNIGEIEIQLPPVFDKIVRSEHHSDYYCGDRYSFFIINKKYSNHILQKTGEFGPRFKKGTPNFYFKIEQDQHLGCTSSNLYPLNDTLANWLADFFCRLNYETKILTKKVSQNMIIIGYQYLRNDSINYMLNIDAYMYIDSNLINFEFVQNGVDDFSIYNEVLKSIENIKVKKIP
ncbi:MAG: hypothetical protein H6Q25_467 [Bacteroidetes bacterium]|nr:hypothetical protein [Bacteroidota bacterium]